LKRVEFAPICTSNNKSCSNPFNKAIFVTTKTI
jgi:hypothetical protein